MWTSRPAPLDIDIGIDIDSNIDGDSESVAPRLDTRPRNNGGKLPPSHWTSPPKVAPDGRFEVTTCLAAEPGIAPKMCRKWVICPKQQELMLIND